MPKAKKTDTKPAKTKVEKTKAPEKVVEEPVVPKDQEVQSTANIEDQTTPASETAKQAKIARPEKGYFFGNGRRKTATARARLYLPTEEIIIAGKKLEKGDIYVNNLPIAQYFSDPLAKSSYTEVYRTTNTANRFITTVITSGSGKTGQLGATVLAISRALVVVDPKFKATLRKKGFMTRDPRMKERKKPGLMGARKQKSSPKR